MIQWYEWSESAYLLAESVVWIVSKRQSYLLLHHRVCLLQGSRIAFLRKSKPFTMKPYYAFLWKSISFTNKTYPLAHQSVFLLLFRSIFFLIKGYFLRYEEVSLSLRSVYISSWRCIIFLTKCKKSTNKSKMEQSSFIESNLLTIKAYWPFE